MCPARRRADTSENVCCTAGINATKAVTTLGGNVVGTVKHSAGLTDFSAFVLQASTSGADAIGPANCGRAVMAKMKATPTDDKLFGKGHIREDGSVIHPIYR